MELLRKYKGRLALSLEEFKALVVLGVGIYVYQSGSI